ncbi:4-alpha-glucanotransferase [Alkalimonas collagenimarina]|uniref:4-alpha-glucanotransferase n=1 Tax=Alkalimonas collagenimarina TaxID=400390 RepID=A0ABT9H276_9GAMM|nr:4-alpha-glucanotransferase [Alkalimonas collagenimarina]MDP4537410.1 4-alpha-glucanotransferase [Alkalimonas collagenimarina]
MDSALLQQGLAMAGIESNYTDAYGQLRDVDEQNLLALLAAQGFDTEDEAALADSMALQQQAIWQQVILPVSVQREDQPLHLELRVPLQLANETLRFSLTMETGQQKRFSLTPVDGELLQVHQDEFGEYHLYQHQLHLELPIGYHRLRVTEPSAKKTEQSLIITPHHCYQPSAFQQQKQWGVSVQLYGVRSERNWGIGDFTDLQQLVTFLAGQGADYVGLNPIHALYPAMPEHASPYSPSSRRWLNSLYIDVSALPGFAACSACQQLVNTTEFQQQLQMQRDKDWVDYSGVMQLKLPVMRTLYQWFIEQADAKSQQAFSDFKQSGGDSLKQLALYDALHAWLYAQDSAHWGWPNWPEAYQQPASPAVKAFTKKHAADIDFYCYLQFCADQQLAAAQQQAKDAGMLLGIYRDLAVGVSEASTEIWANDSLYCREASVGAPPDPLGPQGQNWGLPPMSPMQLFQQGYRPMIELFRSNMQHAGALRIDHVMALLRLWWVPKSAADARGGAYQYYPIMDLLGILALESQRHETLVIGEDLGTVPDGIRDLLHEYGVYSYRVFFFEQAADGGFISPAHYPQQAMATLCTHDLPTLIGFWHCDDLKLGQQLGLYQDEAQLQGLFAERHRNKQRILDSLHGHGMLPDDYPRQVEQVGMEPVLAKALQLHLARGQSQLLCLQLEDWFAMTQPVNVPGTSDEYPNWRRKLSHTLEQLAHSDDMQQLLQQITQSRREQLYSL